AAPRGAGVLGGVDVDGVVVLRALLDAPGAPAGVVADLGLDPGVAAVGGTEDVAGAGRAEVDDRDQGHGAVAAEPQDAVGLLVGEVALVLKLPDAGGGAVVGPDAGGPGSEPGVRGHEDLGVAAAGGGDVMADVVEGAGGAGAEVGPGAVGVAAPEAVVGAAEGAVVDGVEGAVGAEVDLLPAGQR